MYVLFVYAAANPSIIWAFIFIRFFHTKKSYALNLLAWWSVVANPYHTYNTSGSHLLRFLLLLLSRDRWGREADTSSVGDLGKTFLLVGRI